MRDESWSEKLKLKFCFWRDITFWVEIIFLRHGWIPEYGEKDWEALVCEIGRVILGPLLGEILEKFVNDGCEAIVMSCQHGSYPAVKGPGYAKTPQVQCYVNILILGTLIHRLLPSKKLLN